MLLIKTQEGHTAILFIIVCTKVVENIMCFKMECQLRSLYFPLLSLLLQNLVYSISLMSLNRDCRICYNCPFCFLSSTTIFGQLASGCLSVGNLKSHRRLALLSLTTFPGVSPQDFWMGLTSILGTDVSVYYLSHPVMIILCLQFSLTSYIPSLVSLQEASLNP